MISKCSKVVEGAVRPFLFKSRVSSSWRLNRGIRYHLNPRSLRTFHQIPDASVSFFLLVILLRGQTNQRVVCQCVNFCSEIKPYFVRAFKVHKHRGQWMSDGVHFKYVGGIDFVLLLEFHLFFRLIRTKGRARDNDRVRVGARR